MAPITGHSVALNELYMKEENPYVELSDHRMSTTEYHSYLPTLKAISALYQLIASGVFESIHLVTFGAVTDGQKAVHTSLPPLAKVDSKILTSARLLTISTGLAS